MRIFQNVLLIVDADELVTNGRQVTEQSQQAKKEENPPVELARWNVHGACFPTGGGAAASWRLSSSICLARASGTGETVWACSKYCMACPMFFSFSSSRARFTVIFSKPNLFGFLPAVSCSFQRRRASCQILRARTGSCSFS